MLSELHVRGHSRALCESANRLTLAAVYNVLVRNLFPDSQKTSRPMTMQVEPIRDIAVHGHRTRSLFRQGFLDPLQNHNLP